MESVTINVVLDDGIDPIGFPLIFPEGVASSNVRKEVSNVERILNSGEIVNEDGTTNSNTTLSAGHYKFIVSRKCSLEYEAMLKHSSEEHETECTSRSCEIIDLSDYTYDVMQGGRVSFVPTMYFGWSTHAGAVGTESAPRADVVTKPGDCDEDVAADKEALGSIEVNKLT